MIRRRNKPRQRGGLESREQHLSPAQRARIIKRREKLLDELVEALVAFPDAPKPLRRFLTRHDPQELSVILARLAKPQRSFIGEKPILYREYRLTFAKFGGDRRFLSKAEYEALNLEYARLDIDRTVNHPRRRPSQREQELCELVLHYEQLWPDIMPPAVPCRPPDYDAPSPTDYAYPVRMLLGWGWDVDEKRITDNTKNLTKWRGATPDVVRMAMDERLINGWPGDKASWAPIHALLMLGALDAHDVAPQLFALMDLENDWLSDQLPLVWGRMGEPVESVLWDYRDNLQHPFEHRGIAMLGLAQIGRDHHARQPTIVQGFIERLHSAPATDAEVNAFIVHILSQLNANQAADAIRAAFDAGKIDTGIIVPHNVEFL